MTVKTTRVGNILVATLTGEIDLLDSDGLSDELFGLADSNAQGVVLDFSGVTYIASVGIGMLLQLTKTLRAAGTPTRLAGATPAIRTILETVRIGAVLPQDDSVEASLQKLTSIPDA